MGPESFTARYDLVIGDLAHLIINPDLYTQDRAYSVFKSTIEFVWELEDEKSSNGSLTRCKYILYCGIIRAIEEACSQIPDFMLSEDLLKVYLSANRHFWEILHDQEKSGLFSTLLEASIQDVICSLIVLNDSRLSGLIVKAIQLVGDTHK